MSAMKRSTLQYTSWTPSLLLYLETIHFVASRELNRKKRRQAFSARQVIRTLIYIHFEVCNVRIYSRRCSILLFWTELHVHGIRVIFVAYWFGICNRDSGNGADTSASSSIWRKRNASFPEIFRADDVERERNWFHINGMCLAVQDIFALNEASNVKILWVEFYLWRWWWW